MVWCNIDRMGNGAFDISKLTADEKLDLIDALWCSLSTDELRLTLELRADRRLRRLDREHDQHHERSR